MTPPKLPRFLRHRLFLPVVLLLLVVGLVLHEQQTTIGPDTKGGHVYALNAVTLLAIALIVVGHVAAHILPADWCKHIVKVQRAYLRIELLLAVFVVANCWQNINEHMAGHPGDPMVGVVVSCVIEAFVQLIVLTVTNQILKAVLDMFKRRGGDELTKQINAIEKEGGMGKGPVPGDAPPPEDTPPSPETGPGINTPPTNGPGAPRADEPVTEGQGKRA